jgi:hypothetical protein
MKFGVSPSDLIIAACLASGIHYGSAQQERARPTIRQWPGLQSFVLFMGLAPPAVHQNLPLLAQRLRWLGADPNM